MYCVWHFNKVVNVNIDKLRIELKYALLFLTDELV